MSAAAADGRTQGALRRREAVTRKPEMVAELIKRAMDAGIFADYVLMDTWFTTEPLLLRLRQTGLHVVGMVKQLKQRYFIGSEAYTIPGLLSLARRSGSLGRSDIIGSVYAKTKAGINVKIVFIINRNKRSEYLAVLSTDVSLSDDEIIGLYARRFSIEANFYNMKHYFRLSKENQGRSFDSTVAYNALCILRLLILEWMERGSDDTSTIGGLFHKVREDLLMVPFADAVTRLMKVFDSVPDRLISEGLMDPRHREKALELIHEMLDSAFNSSGRFIREFMDSSRRQALPETASRAAD